MKKSIAAIGLCALGALLFTATPLRAGDDKNAIMPGVGIGPVRLKTEITEVETLLGKTSDNMLLGYGARVWFTKSASGKDEEMVVSITRGDDGMHYFVDEVVVTSPEYRTPAGNTTRNDLATLWKEFPDLTWRETGEALDGTIMELYSAKTSGVGVMIERPRGTTPTARAVPGVPTGKCRALFVQLAGKEANFLQLGRHPEKTDAE